MRCGERLQPGRWRAGSGGRAAAPSVLRGLGSRAASCTAACSIPHPICSILHPVCGIPRCCLQHPASRLQHPAPLPAASCIPGCSIPHCCLWHPASLAAASRIPGCTASRTTDRLGAFSIPNRPPCPWCRVQPPPRAVLPALASRACGVGEGCSGSQVGEEGVISKDGDLLPLLGQRLTTITVEKVS